MLRHDHCSDAPSAKEKIAKMALMLSSDNDGEVVAAASAIGRMLKVNGWTWHDLAAQISAQLEQPRIDVRWVAIWEEGDEVLLNLISEMLHERELTEWQEGFLLSIDGLIKRGSELTDKQRATVRKVWSQTGGSSAK